MVYFLISVVWHAHTYIYISSDLLHCDLRFLGKGLLKKTGFLKWNSNCELALSTTGRWLLYPALLHSGRECPERGSRSTLPLSLPHQVLPFPLPFFLLLSPSAHSSPQDEKINFVSRKLLGSWPNTSSVSFLDLLVPFQGPTSQVLIYIWYDLLARSNFSTTRYALFLKNKFSKKPYGI